MSQSHVVLIQLDTSVIDIDLFLALVREKLECVPLLLTKSQVSVVILIGWCGFLSLGATFVD